MDWPDWARKSIDRIYNIECWTYADKTQKTHCGQGTPFPEVNERWLNGPPPTSAAGNQQPIAGMRFVGIQHKNIWDSQDHVLYRTLRIAHLLGLSSKPDNPSADYHDFRNFAGACGSYVGSKKTGEKAYVFFRSIHADTVSIFLRYNKTSKVTVGYLICAPMAPLTAFWESIKAEADNHSTFNPLFLPTRMLELYAQWKTDNMTAINLRLSEVERTTGFGGWHIPPDAVDDSMDKFTAEYSSPHKYSKLAQIISELNSQAIFCDSDLRRYALATAFLIKELNCLTEGHPSPLALGCDGLRRRLDFLDSRIQHMSTDGVRQRAESQQNVVST